MVPVETRSRATSRLYSTGEHQKARAAYVPLVLAGQVTCWRCGSVILPHEPWDMGHVDGDPSRYAGPEHRWCNRATKGRLDESPPDIEELPERDGLEPGDVRWRVPWLKPFLKVPADATWPRLMTVPHPAATGSLGSGFAKWAEARSGRPLRWWQRLAATRMLEHDKDGLLVWDAVLLSLARQLGKSWLLRELCIWRMGQGERWGESQDVLHTGKDLAVVIEVQRPARLWAKELPEYRVREANGQERIEYQRGLGGRWLCKAKGAPYGHSISFAVVDEAWYVEPNYIEEGVAPTMVERLSPQLMLVSTAHRLATSLMMTRRKVALEELETGAGDLLVEWSAPRGAAVDDPKTWRLASPHWTPARQKLIQRRLDAMYAGETQDPTEPDPAESFRAQWLNQWPKELAVMVGEELLPPGQWRRLTVDGAVSDGPVWVAVEDREGLGAAVAAACRLDDGRIEVDGWLCDDWDSALRDVDVLGMHRQIKSLQVGASMLSRVPPGMVPQPAPAGGRETRLGLPLLRDLAANGMVAHEPTTGELNLAVTSARVKPGAAGLILVPSRSSHLVKALVWAVVMAHRPAPVAAVF